MSQAQDYWENRYQTRDMPWEKGAPSPGLVDFLAAHPKLRRGTVAVPGGGTGHDAREWARAGFRTYGFDIAPSAIQLSKERTEAAAQDLGAPASRRQQAANRQRAGETPAVPGKLDIHFRLADFLHDKPPQRFDWLFEHTLFCAINLS